MIFMQAQSTPNPRLVSRASAPAIRPGDRVRIFDALHSAYHWHSVEEIITGHRPQIKVNGYSTFISASLIAGHQKGTRRHG
jgi:hypothetical protein